MNKSKPKVTVLMSVYNGEKYLSDSITSILDQTFTDFEFLIIDDGSTDHSVDIIKSFKDSRIHLNINEKNIGLTATLNKGLDIAQGTYVARMDCDDFSLPNRLQKQVEFMDSNPHIGVSGTFYTVFCDSEIKGYSNVPIQHEIIKTMLFFSNCLCHPSTMIRMSCLNKYKLRYNPAHLYAQDYGLWIQCSFLFQLANIPEFLLLYRINSSGISQIHSEQQTKIVRQIQKINIERLGITDIDDEMLELHNQIMIGKYPFDNEKLMIKTKTWLEKLLDVHRLNPCYPEPHFSNMIQTRLIKIREQFNYNTNAPKQFNS